VRNENTFYPVVWGSGNMGRAAIRAVDAHPELRLSGVVVSNPRIEVNVEASDEGSNRAAGGNATAANRLVNAVPWLLAAEPGLYDALDVPLAPATGCIARNRKDDT
jgi:hypothetical protein